MAERRKNEPQLDQSQDQLVRKIFSKFRRDKTSHHTTNTTGGNDVERGGLEKPDSAKTQQHDDSTKADNNNVSVLSAAGGSGNLTTVVTKPAGSRSSSTAIRNRWSRLGGSSSVDSVTSETSTPKFSKLQKSTSASFEANNNLSPATATRSIHRQDTIEECSETISSTADKIPTTNQSVPPIICHCADGNNKSDERTKELLSNIAELKTDMKAEVKNINQRIEKMEEMLKSVLEKLNEDEDGRKSNARRTVLTLVCREQQTDLSYQQQQQQRDNHHHGGYNYRISPPSERDSPPTDCAATPLGNIVLRKRRSKSRCKGGSPSAIPFRSFTSRPRYILRTQELLPDDNPIPPPQESSSAHPEDESPTEYL